MVVYLVPAGSNRFELYSETPEEAPPPPGADAGTLQRWMHGAHLKWHALVEHARHNRGSGRFARWRDQLVCRLAENIAEQRTLWGLRGCTHAQVQHSADLAAASAERILKEQLAAARRHHGRWLIVDLILLIVSGVLALVPGPNLLAYYFLFRLIGHLQSWRGARRALEGVAWTYEPNTGLTELSALVDVPRATRAPRVAAIAERLNLPRLTAFFDRVAVPSP